MYKPRAVEQHIKMRFSFDQIVNSRLVGDIEYGCPDSVDSGNFGKLFAINICNENIGSSFGKCFGCCCPYSLRASGYKRLFTFESFFHGTERTRTIDRLPSTQLQTGLLIRERSTRMQDQQA